MSGSAFDPSLGKNGVRLPYTSGSPCLLGSRKSSSCWSMSLGARFWGVADSRTTLCFLASLKNPRRALRLWLLFLNPCASSISTGPEFRSSFLRFRSFDRFASVSLPRLSTSASVSPNSSQVRSHICIRLAGQIIRGSPASRSLMASRRRISAPMKVFPIPTTSAM